MSDLAHQGAAGGIDLELEDEYQLELLRIKAEKLENEEMRVKLEYKMKKKLARNGAKKRRAESYSQSGEEEYNGKRAKANEQENAAPPMTAKKMNENTKEKSKQQEAKPKDKDNAMSQIKAKKGASDKPAQAGPPGRKCRCCHYEPEDPQRLASCSHIYCKHCVDFLRAEAMRRGKVHARCMVCDELMSPSYHSGGVRGDYRRAFVEDVDENDGQDGTADGGGGH